jgi:hypothetical protein
MANIMHACQCNTNETIQTQHTHFNLNLVNDVRAKNKPISNTIFLGMAADNPAKDSLRLI